MDWRPLKKLCILIFALGLPHAARSTDSWRRVNVDNLKVRERPGAEYEVIDTLPFRLPVLIKDQYQDWCEIDHRGLPVVWSDGIHLPFGKHPPPEHHGGYWVRCHQLVAFEPVGSVPARAGMKRFFSLEQEVRDLKGKYIPSKKEGFFVAELGSYFEVISEEGGSLRLINYDGNPIVPPEAMLKSGRIVSLPWDLANNLPIYTPPRPKDVALFMRYLYFVAVAIDEHRSFWWGAFALAAGLGFCSSLGKRSDDDMPGSTLVLVLVICLLIGACQGSNINEHEASVAHLEQSRYIFTHLNFDGKTLPFTWSYLPGNKIEMVGPVELELGDLIWVPTLLLAHACLLFSLPRIIRGAHFLVSRPPDQQTLSRSSDGHPPPSWVSQNWTKHLNRQETKLRARIASAKSRVARNRSS